jgi:hypothetical protein
VKGAGPQRGYARPGTEGPGALRKLYATRGYIDFTPTALREIDDARARISLEMELDEQKQFHVGKVEVLGAEPAIETFCSRRQSLAMF